MRFALSAVVLAFPLTAIAEDGGTTVSPQVGTKTKAVIGGAPAPAGKWPDTVALRDGGSQFCTGTLIAPTVVLTAGHCVDGSAVEDVLAGGGPLSRPQDGEVLRVFSATPYPDSWDTVDAAVLVLSTPATTPPRAIATGWARFDIQNGAPVALVGYGTTDRNASVSTDVLMEASSTITDAGCTTSSGCNVAARPDGELGAGGMGIDTCPGDSGGPLYLTTSYGSYLAGITSRGYNNNRYYCSEGGIYGRADKIVAWIEQTTGVKVTRGPEPSAEPITTVRGVGAETRIVPNDPVAGTQHTFAIVTPPQYGTAAVRDDGTVRVCPAKDVVGGDSLVVSVTDQSNPTRSVNAVINVAITDGDPDDDCDPNDFGGGGCCDTRRSASGSIPLALFVLLVLRRRRPRGA